MRPAPGLVVALLAWALVGAFVAFGVLDPRAWVFAGALLGGVAVVDALWLARTPTPSARRDLPRVVPVGVETEGWLHLHAAGRTRVRVEAHEGLPGDWPRRGLPRTLRLKPGRESSVAYRFTALDRGGVTLDGCQLRLSSPLRLWKHKRLVALAQQLRVYPNFAPLARFALFSAEQASRVVGAHIARHRGEGTEFQQLREYRVGDPLRQIDWKASRRAHKLISREYQHEKNQQVLLLLDTGRRMLAKDDALAHFDHVLNAALVVSYLALRQGDAVGLLASGGAHRWLAPRRGLGAVDTLLNTVYDLQAEPVATDYLAAATELTLRQSRRSLVLLVTNVRDEDVGDLLAAVTLLQRRHLVCVASLREVALDHGLERPVQTLEDAIGIGALAQYLDARDAAHKALRSRGVTVLDVTCAQLPAALVETYLSVKRAGRL
jgi:uncharacterized protein (DUF58 family)